jgi:hypothetical protein
MLAYYDAAQLALELAGRPEFKPVRRSSAYRELTADVQLHMPDGALVVIQAKYTPKDRAPESTRSLLGTLRTSISEARERLDSVTTLDPVVREGSSRTSDLVETLAVASMLLENLTRMLVELSYLAAVATLSTRRDVVVRDFPVPALPSRFAIDRTRPGAPRGPATHRHDFDVRAVGQPRLPHPLRMESVAA